jgi:hypothetical protein
MMKPYERSYASGRMVSDVLEGFGWLIVAVGLVLAVVGFASGGFVAIIQTLPRGEVPFLSRAIGAIPGITLCLFGLVSVMLAQIGVATLNSAEMQREVLYVLRNNGNLPSVSEASSPELEQEETPGAPLTGPPEEIDFRNEFPSHAHRITSAEVLRDGRVTVTFENDYPVEYADLDEARKYLR